MRRAEAGAHLNLNLKLQLSTMLMQSTSSSRCSSRSSKRWRLHRRHVVLCCSLLPHGCLLSSAQEEDPAEALLQQQQGEESLVQSDGKAPPPPMLSSVYVPQSQPKSDGVCDYHGIEIKEECPSSVSGFDWEVYGEELYRARSMIFSNRVEEAKAAVYNLLSHITKRFSFAFECPLATVSTYWTLATILMFQGSMRRALSMLQMAFIFVRDKGFHECTPWPVQGWDMMMAGRNLLAEVQKLDRPAIRWDTPKHFRYNGVKIAIVTICSYAPDEAVRVISIENHGLYARLHDYDLHMYLSPDEIAPNEKSGMNVKDGVHKPFFWKVNAVKNVFDAENAPDWVLWADCDALFMDPERTIDSVIHMYTANFTSPIVKKQSTLSGGVSTDPEQYEMIGDFLNNPGREKNQQPFSDVHLLLAVDSTGINNGVWMLRNSKWGHDFLERWWHSRILEGPGENHNCSDQSTMQHELLYENSMALDPMWDSVEGPIWPSQVRVVYQEHMQSFHQATAITVLSREWEQGDFIRHHPGCHYYKEPCKWLYGQAHEIFMTNLQNMSSRIPIGE